MLSTPPAGSALKRAAVALAVSRRRTWRRPAGHAGLAEWSDAAALILTRRSGALRSHRGQWALPGGRIEHGESAEQTALREMAEEVGLQLAGDAVLGRLDDYATRSGISSRRSSSGPARRGDAGNPAEVASIHRIGLDEFLRSDAPLLEAEPARPASGTAMPVGDSWIAAPTAALMYQFREVCLLGRPPASPISTSRTLHGAEPAGEGLLSSQPFRGLWLFAGIYFLGNAMQAMAAAWLMVELTGSSFLAALVQTAVFLPMFLLSLPAGVLADTTDRARLISRRAGGAGRRRWCCWRRCCWPGWPGRRRCCCSPSSPAAAPR